MSDTLIRVERVSKKFCKNLKRSMRYGGIDILTGLTGHSFNNDKLRKNEFWALKDISFELKRGECLGLIGPNGSGKSTLLKVLNGIIALDMGKVTIKGKVGALVEVGAGFHPMLTGRENIYINGSILGFSKKEMDHKFDEIVHFSELEEFIDTPVKQYSSGMYVRLGFAIAAQMKPDVLLIDEVLAVGDIAFRAKCYNMIGERLQNCAVIIVSHSMPEIARLCSNILLLKKGNCNYFGNDKTEGMDRYYRSHNKPEGVVISSDQGEFLEISVIASEKNNIPTINFHGELKAKMKARVKQTVISPVFHIAILNQGLQNVYHSASSYSGTKIVLDKECITLSVTLDDLSLHPGIYYIDFAITDSNHVKIIARTHLKHRLQIIGSLNGYGIILTEGKWSQEIK